MNAKTNLWGFVKVYEAFCGIGGFSLGFQQAGFEIVGSCEIDPYARAVYTKNFGIEPDRDIRSVTSISADIICGGFPCQDISIANQNRTGLEGKRSGLWWELARIIKNSSPRYVVLENVPALLYSGFGDILRFFSEIGFDVEWDCLSAKSFGAIHERDRIFIVAYSNSRFKNGLSIREEKGFSTIGKCNKNVFENAFIQPISIESAFCRKDDGIPRRLDRLRCLGNAIVPQVSYWIAKRIKEIESRK